MCGLCKFRKDLEDGELSVAQIAVRLHKKLTSHELSHEDYTLALHGLDFPSVRALRDEAAMWLCTVCKEKVPATMNGCWKCRSSRPGLLSPDSPGDDALPRLPDAVTRPSNPWEQ
jgi:hypothetical protein